MHADSQTYHLEVDFVWKHANHAGDAVREHHSSFDIFLGLLRRENRHVDDLKGDADVGELRRQVRRLAELPHRVLSQTFRGGPGHFSLAITVEIKTLREIQI